MSTAPGVVRIVVADDHQVVRTGFAGLLGTQPDFAVAGVARDGAEAVQVCAEVHPDVVLMDVRMPGMDGPDAMKLIRARKGPNRGTPILAFSADVGSIGSPDFMALGFDGQIGKPLTARELICGVAQVLAATPKPVRKRKAG
jgi:DNA-binding NarL/FixJ family response regulator